MIQPLWQEAQLSPRDPRDALYQLKCWPTVVRITQTDCVSAWGALSATATFYSATCIMYSFVHASLRQTRSTIAQWACDASCHIHVTLKWAVRVINILPYNKSCWCQLDRNCDQQTSTTTKVVDDTAYSSLFLNQHTIVDADHRGGWIQISGVKASEPETSWPVEKHNFYLPHLHLAPPVGADLFGM